LDYNIPALKQERQDHFSLQFQEAFDFQAFRQANEESDPKPVLINGVQQSATEKARGTRQQNDLLAM
jgi:hypothetical protein